MWFEFGYLYYLQAAFVIWMLMDAYNRRVEQYWMWVILFFQPVGAWAYFFLYKVGDLRDVSLPGGFTLFQRRPSLDQLRYQVNQTPSLTSHLALAERLIEMKEYEEAGEHLRIAHAREPEHCQVLYLLAISLEETGKPEQALPLIDQIVARDRRWSDYSAWRLMVKVKTKLNDPGGATAAAREAARLSPTLQHRCLLAERLLAEGKKDEAKSILAESLEDYRYAPGPIRRKNRSWAKQAQRLQKQV